MESEIHICSKCQRVIPFGTPYFAICRSLEFFTKNKETLETEIEIVEAEEVTSLCKTCGSVFNQGALEVILEHIPIPGQETRN